MKHILTTALVLLSFSAFSQAKKADTIITQKLTLTLDVKGFNELFYRLSTSGEFTGIDIKQYEEFLKQYMKPISDTVIKKR